jgi:hypothetical protein
MALRHALTVEEIINGFPNPVLPKIDHELTFEDIQVTTLLLNANAISIPSLSGGGAHGHMDIIMTQVEYTGIIGTPWEEPYDPGTISLIATGTPPINAAQIVRLHDEFRCVHKTHVSVDQALKRIILEAYKNM